MTHAERVAIRAQIRNTILDDDVDALSKMYTPDAYDESDHRTAPALCSCISYEAFKCGQWLISSANVDVNRMCDDHTLLCYAVIRRDVKFVNMLVDAGARLEDIGYEGKYTALDLACISSDYPMACMLIDHGAMLNVDKHTNLHDNAEYPRVVAYYDAHLQRRARQRAFVAAVLSLSKMNRDLVRLFSIKR
jgi:ankyrin repeat protein